MRQVILSILISVFAQFSSAQEITGQWNGTLKVPGGQLSLIYHITKKDGGYSATMDSPDQKAQGIPVQSVALKDSILHLDMTNFGITYDGKFKGRTIDGFFKQNGQTYPLNLQKHARPQEPVQPYPYYSENVKFENKKEQVTLAGTLTMPSKSGKYPAVILINGSGPQNRNSEVFGHKPFLVLSDHLTKNGLAVLRFDDRGTAESTGNFGTATTVDFASDVAAGLAYLKTRPEIDIRKIGLIGHSEGGLIAPIVATQSSDVRFVVLLAAPGMRGDEILALQSKILGKANGLADSTLVKGELTNRKIYQALKAKTSLDEIKKQLTVIIEDALKILPAAQQPPADQRATFVAQKVNSIATPWFQFFVSYEPVPTLEKLKCPVLALNGAYDQQVMAQENLTIIEKSLKKAGNKNYKVKELPTLNHLFQESNTGSPDEYSIIEQTFAPAALAEITNWINIQVKK
jgi:pimeloyl-ACP methyl ester carboxylesterase